MPKRTIESALSASLRAEQQALEKRLTGLSERAAKADAVLQRQGTAPDDGPSGDQRREKTSDAFSASREAPYLRDRLDEEEEGEHTEGGKVMRANFSMPYADYELMNRLRERCSRYGVILTRSEILRAGLHALDQLAATQLLAVIRSLERLKPGPVKRRVHSTRTRDHSSE